MEHKTYAEVQGADLFDWRKFLSTEEHTKEEWRDASILARSWITCACGNQCAIIPRYDGNPEGGPQGMPIDDRLADLGSAFSAAIDHHHTEEAIEILDAIEERSAHLIAEITKQSKP